MDGLLTIGAVIVAILLFGGAYWLLHHVSLPTRARHADPEAAEALRETQRQIEQGHESDGLARGWHRR